MNFLERYRNGEYVQVWNELLALGPNVRSEPHYAQAQEVATETMRRVRRNCERLISSLRTFGYVFGTFPDGTRRSYQVEPLTPPSASMRADSDELASGAGPLPISLTTFWQEVGAIDFAGRHPAWPDGLDPLVVDPPEGALSFLFDEEDDSEGQFAGLALDDLHKDNTSGGDPYGVRLPDPSADFMFVDERHNLFFVPYLRLAILDWAASPVWKEEAFSLSR